MKTYHAHLYFHPDRETEARVLYEKAKTRNGLDFDVWNFFPQMVGPHALPMIELHFNEETEVRALNWLKKNHDSYSVLIHEDTGEDLRDHLEGVRWLGNPLCIHFDFFKRVALDQGLSIHPVSSGV